MALGLLINYDILFPAVLNDNLFETSIKFDVPFYITQGDHDYMVSKVLAERYLEAGHAPKKEFISFENSAHFLNMEESIKFIEILRRIAL